METVCSVNKCTGCNVCVNICPKNAISVRDSIEAYNACIDEGKCINCNLCKHICPVINHRQLQKPIYWKQGWASNDIRKNSSSGGVATAIITSFIKDGGYVASCLFDRGEFVFSTTNSLETAKSFSGSKYVKSKPGLIYKDIKKLLLQGEKVLFVGLPCQSAAVQNYCNHERLYTVDLICHGTPSPFLLEKYLMESGVDIKECSNVLFRSKDEGFGLSRDNNKIVPTRVMDSYTFAFLNSLDYTENCYSCRYACLDRVSDITLGDAWGQLADKDPRGVSLILGQTEKGISLIESASITLKEVDLQDAVKANAQLNHPAIQHPKRSGFLKRIEQGSKFRYAVMIAFPVNCIKQSIKTGLIKMKIVKDSPNTGGGYRLIVFDKDVR